MPKFPELSASLGEALDLPVPLPGGGTKTYSVPQVTAEDWMWLTVRFAQRPASSDDEEIDDTSEHALYKKCLGPVYDQLVTDSISWQLIRRCGLTALAWQIRGEDAALQVWEGGAVPKPSQPETKEGTTPAEAPSTPSRASGSGTTRSRKTPGSRGKASSNAGGSLK